MNLKNISITSATLIVISFLLMCVGTVFIYFPILGNYFSWNLIISIVIPFSTKLMEDIALIIFFLAFLNQLKNDSAQMPPLFPLAGFLLILAAVIFFGYNSIQVLSLYQHANYPRPQLFLNTGMNILYSFEILVLGLFILTRAVNKPLAVLTIIAHLGHVALSITWLARFSTFSQNSVIQNLGSTITYSSYVISQAAILLFMFAFLLRSQYANNAASIESIPA